VTLLKNFSGNEDFFTVFWTRLTNVLVERDKEDKECSSEEEDSNKKGRMPTGDIKNMLHSWEEFLSLAKKWHPQHG
jgi:hypothetical protein